MNKKLAAVFALVLAAASVFAGGRQENPSGIVLALSGNPDTLDPHATTGTLTFQTVKSVYDTLVEVDRTGKIVPALAESWEVSSDGLVWTFELRPGVTFHHGKPLAAEDVKASFDRIRDEAFASPSAGEFAEVESIEADGLTVTLRLGAPSAPLLSTLASGWAAILPADLIAAGHNFALEPVGTGPFFLGEYLPDHKIFLQKNESYWMPGLPALDSVTLQVIPERALQVQGLLSGAVDIVYILDALDLPLLEADPDVAVDRSLSSLVMVLAMNVSREGLDDLGFRQGVAHAVDKQQVLDIAYGGGEPIGTFMDPSDPYYADFTDLYPYDPALAAELVAANDPGRTYVMVLPQNFEPHVRAGELYQEMLENVGIDVEIKLVDWPTWISDVYRNANFDFTVIGHTGKLDPHGRLNGYGTDAMYVRWINDDVAGLIAQGAAIADPADRKPVYDRVLGIMAEELPFVFVGSSYRHIGHRTDVTGFFMTPNLDSFDFRWTEK